MKHNPLSNSSFGEVTTRCEKRHTKIRTVVTTQHEGVYVLIFNDGTQATVDEPTLVRLNEEGATLFQQRHAA